MDDMGAVVGVGVDKDFVLVEGFVDFLLFSAPFVVI